MTTIVSCSEGIYDCAYNDIPSDVLQCAEYDSKFMDMESEVWPVIVASIVMCAMAFGVGANGMNTQ